MYPDGTYKAITNKEIYKSCELNSHFTGYHLALPEVESMLAALMIQGPDVPESKEISIPMNVVDIASTIARLLNIDTPKNFEVLINYHLVESIL